MPEGGRNGHCQEKAKVAHSRRNLRARVKCVRAVMKAKYEYCMAVQEARAERCTELEESEATYSEAPNRNVAPCLSSAPRSVKNTRSTCGNWKHML